MTWFWIGIVIIHSYIFFHLLHASILRHEILAWKAKGFAVVANEIVGEVGRWGVSPERGGAEPCARRQAPRIWRETSNISSEHFILSSPDLVFWYWSFCRLAQAASEALKKNPLITGTFSSINTLFEDLLHCLIRRCLWCISWDE